MRNSLSRMQLILKKNSIEQFETSPLISVNPESL